MEGPRTSRQQFLVRAAALAGLACLLVPIPQAVDSALWGRVGDIAHVPLFVLVHLTARDWWQERSRRPLVASVVTALAFAAASELLQYPVGRDPDIADFCSDAMGTALSACWLLLRGGPVRRWAVYWLAVVLLGGYHGAVIAREVAIVRAARALWPVIADFEGGWQLRRWHAKERTAMRATAEEHADGIRALRVECREGGYPGVAVEEVDADWSRYDALEWTVMVPDRRPLELSVRIDEVGTNKGCTIRVLIREARQVVRLNIRDSVGCGCQLDWSRIGELHFFLDEPPHPRTFFLDRVRLIR
jgi:hypothetical protein